MTVPGEFTRPVTKIFINRGLDSIDQLEVIDREVRLDFSRLLIHHHQKPYILGIISFSKKRRKFKFVLTRPRLDLERVCESLLLV